jgi:hypothetical protein
MEKGRGMRLGRANRASLEFDGDGRQKVVAEKVQAKMDAFTLRQDEILKPSIQESRTKSGDGDYDPRDDADDEDDDDDEVCNGLVPQFL